MPNRRSVFGGDLMQQDQPYDDGAGMKRPQAPKMGGNMGGVQRPQMGPQMMGPPVQPMPVVPPMDPMSMVTPGGGGENSFDLSQILQQLRKGY